MELDLMKNINSNKEKLIKELNGRCHNNGAKNFKYMKEIAITCICH